MEPAAAAFFLNYTELFFLRRSAFFFSSQRARPIFFFIDANMKYHTLGLWGGLRGGSTLGEVSGGEANGRMGRFQAYIESTANERGK